MLKSAIRNPHSEIWNDFGIRLVGTLLQNIILSLTKSFENSLKHVKKILNFKKRANYLRFFRKKLVVYFISLYLAAF
jgi:hypothetical protein